MPYPCSHFYFDINFVDRFYSKKRQACEFLCNFKWFIVLWPHCALLKCIENQNAHNLSVKYAVMYREQINQITCMILPQTIFQRTRQIWQVFLHLTIDQGLFPVLFFINFYRALRAK